jgi:hypothetical protein
VLAAGIIFLALGIFSVDDATWSRVVEIVAGLIMTLLAVRELRGGPPA